jgi:hypothetical protein
MFFKRDVILAQEYLGFLLLNLCDLFLTGWIFRHNGSEANPLAVWCLRHGGYHTFVIVKFALITIVVLACEGYSLKDVRVSRVIITAGCLVYLAVVVYECFLIWKFIQLPKVNNTESSVLVTPAPMSPVALKAPCGYRYMLRV